jgi:hypothetical protein
MPGPLDLTNEKISFSFDRLIQTDGAGNFFDGLGDPVSITGAGTSGTSGTSGVGTSGTSGASGTSGSSGTSGVAGTSGTSGLAGTSGSSGTSGIGGTSGTSGIGTDGTSGTSGIGTDGTSGTSGIDGTSGSSGTSGVDGTSGTSGVDGTSGSSGTSGASGTSGTSGTIEFYYSQTPPSPDPTNVGARWLDSDNGIEYVWVWDGSDYYWVQPTQLGRVTYKAFYINTATYSPTFAYEYYGVTYNTGICTVTLPLGVTPTDEGKFINIADEAGGISYGNRGILVQGQGGQLINGEASVLMKIDRMSLNFLFRNNSWKTI